jgi:hypothetical protein
VSDRRITWSLAKDRIEIFGDMLLGAIVLFVIQNLLSVLVNT